MDSLDTMARKNGVTALHVLEKGGSGPGEPPRAHVGAGAPGMWPGDPVDGGRRRKNGKSRDRAGQMDLSSFGTRENERLKLTGAGLRAALGSELRDASALRFLEALKKAQTALNLARWPWIQPLIDDVVVHLMLTDELEVLEFGAAPAADAGAAAKRYSGLLAMRKALRASVMDLQQACLNAMQPTGTGLAADYARLVDAAPGVLALLASRQRPGAAAAGGPLEGARPDSQASPGEASPEGAEEGAEDTDWDGPEEAA